MNIIEKIKSLNFKADQYVIIGSGIMDALGIRKAADVDISVTKELFEELRKTGDWEEITKYIDRPFLKRDVFEINQKLDWNDYYTTTEEAIASAQIIEGVPFMNLQELCKFKKTMGREKDFNDIKLIKEYIDKN